MRLIIALLAVLPLPAFAHPHMFVDSRLDLTLDADQNVTGLTLSWSYDEFSALLILEDMGLDPDGDAQLTEAELARLKGFDLIEWPEGFEGDLYFYRDGVQVPLDHPQPSAIAVTDGRITASHTRSLTPTPAEGLQILQYDPTYYVAYTLSGGVHLPTPCRATLIPADPDAATQALAEELKKVPEDQFSILEIGVHYAEDVRITCNAPS
ncbi:ABC-type uncharacterized transport system, substrate-binding protein [Puniceibacterium sediminis]|uniref:ABC-type uncharacterized transport system, substrate-binding protein n=2 Tax=Puniceibacterium sediminis TaxID=1608407 RepID=A0A238XWP8_9RHOB|nr:ABC-type uncharacterized transport system, substrate-binding protein [Puniceibacterium sediminis]